MQIVCTICSEVMNQTADVHATKCGHIFHYRCLMQWVDISKTCPQCRNYVGEYSIFRLYLTMENSIDEVTALETRLETLQQELQKNKKLAEEKEQENTTIINDLLTNMTNMKHYENKAKDQEELIKTLHLRINEYVEKIVEKDKYIGFLLINTDKHLIACSKIITECNEKLNKRELEMTTMENLLGDLVKTSEEKLISRKLAVAALEEEMEYVKKQNVEIDALRQENVQLKKEVKALNGRVQKLAVRTLKRQKQKRKASDEETVVAKRKRSSIYSSIDDIIIADDNTGYPSRLASIKSKKMGKKTGNMANNSRSRVLRILPKIEFSGEGNLNIPDNTNNIFDEYTECDMLQHMQFQLQIC